MGKLNSYRIYFHGEPVGFVDEAMTCDEARVRFHNKNREYSITGLMACAIDAAQGGKGGAA